MKDDIDHRKRERVTAAVTLLIMILLMIFTFKVICFKAKRLMETRHTPETYYIQNI